MMTTGNAAKMYCLRQIEDLARARGPLRILDLGSGTSLNFLSLLERYPQISYTGVEPSERACAVARSALRRTGVRIVQSLAYAFRDGEPFDVVASFSVLEHVYRRREYLACAKRNLAPDGIFFINYDAGHFQIGAGWRDRVKTMFGGAMAAVGQERWYQALVRENEFRRLIGDVGFRVVEDRIFNTPLKRIQPLVPEPLRPAFDRRWLEFEEYLNTIGIEYRDEYASVFNTRHFVLAHAIAP